MGRSPRPAGLKLIEGRGNGRDSAGRPIPVTPKFEREAPSPPDWLPDEARAEWYRVVPALARLDLLKAVDRAALVGYCLTWDRMVQAYRDVAAGKLTTRGSQGQLVKHPSVMVLEAASKELRAWCQEFGLTPSAELRLGKIGGADDGSSANPFAETG